jgi:CheY-like chemotaxis protein
VDDDADDADIFCEALCRIAASMKCMTAENGLKLFEILSEDRPDVIFLDINMPKLSGWETLRKLKDDTEYNNIPVIMYSTSSSRKDIEIAYGLGARLFITKPEDFRELSKILEIVATGLGEEQISRLKEFASVRVNLN